MLDNRLHEGHQPGSGDGRIVEVVTGVLRPANRGLEAKIGQRFFAKGQIFSGAGSGVIAGSRPSPSPIRTRGFGPKTNKPISPVAKRPSHQHKRHA